MGGDLIFNSLPTVCFLANKYLLTAVQMAERISPAITRTSEKSPVFLLMVTGQIESAEVWIYKL